MKTPDQLYKFHVANVRRVGQALDCVALAARQAIAREDKDTANVFVMSYLLLLGAWAEARLQKVLYEAAAFTDAERNSVDAVPTHLDKWKKVVEMVFRRHYAIPNASLQNLPFSARAKYSEVVDLLNAELRVVIEVRNKLAHGQWHYPIVHSGNDVASDLMALMRKENLLTLQFKKSLISSILDMVNDLAVSPPTFERDFDVHHRQVTESRVRLKTVDYNNYALSLKNKYRRGIEKRKNNLVARLS